MQMFLKSSLNLKFKLKPKSFNMNQGKQNCHGHYPKRLPRAQSPLLYLRQHIPATLSGARKGFPHKNEHRTRAEAAVSQERGGTGETEGPCTVVPRRPTHPRPQGLTCSSTARLKCTFSTSLMAVMMYSWTALLASTASPSQSPIVF